ncbi:MAG: glycoside hydrolase family 99-like domain-containing protein [Nitrospira sp.]|nr:glycoside hydrolase family 99-like domain-containing protein [Nitrospira sp.]
MAVQARLIAFYLPQFHPIPENDSWWGKGFTEWTNVAKARPLYKGHYQPRLPADLGYYDLRVPEVREAQAELARNAGIEGFCYYHYWFGGKRLLERPFAEVVASGKPDFPFCLCWANQTWSGIWHGDPKRTLIEQTYPGVDDNRRHFMALREAFLDERYLRVEGRPIFVIYRPNELPDVTSFIRQWQELAIQSGLPGIHFVAHLFSHDPPWDFRSRGFDGCTVVSSHRIFSVSLRQIILAQNINSLSMPGQLSVVRNRDAFKGSIRDWVWRRCRRSLGQFGWNVRQYRQALPYLLYGCSDQPGVYPMVTPNWDNTARSHIRGIVLHGSTPELFRTHLQDALSHIKSRRPEDRVIFVKSWNEWAEGNYLEPDKKFGHDYLKVVKEEVSAPVGQEAEFARDSSFVT